MPAVRQPVAVGLASRRRLEERVGLRFPGLLVSFTRAWLGLPPSSRVRRAVIRRAVRLGIEAANRRDYAAAFALHAPDVELLVPSGLAAMGLDSHVRGRAERIRFEVKWRTEWGDFQYAPDELIDLGSRVLVLGRMKGSGPSSGAAFDNEWAVLFEIANGQVVHEQVFLDRAEASEAAGLGKLQAVPQG